MSLLPTFFRPYSDMAESVVAAGRQFEERPLSPGAFVVGAYRGRQQGRAIERSLVSARQTAQIGAMFERDEDVTWCGLRNRALESLVGAQITALWKEGYL